MADTTDTSSGVSVARPTINVAGTDYPALEQELTSLLIVETLSGLYRCEAAFGNWGLYKGTTDFLYFDRQTLDFGKALKDQVWNPDSI